MTLKLRNVSIAVVSWFILIELVLLISELLTKFKNSKYFLSYCKKCKHVFTLYFQPISTPKIDVFLPFFCNKDGNYKFFSLKLYQIVRATLYTQIKQFGPFKMLFRSEKFIFSLFGPTFSQKYPCLKKI